MRRIVHYGPSVVLAMVVVAAVVGGPFMARQIAYAQQQGRVAEARDRLASSAGPLLDLNESFRAVARTVEPSVVHVSVRRKPGQAPTSPFMGREIDPFERLLPPELRERFPDLRPRREPQPQRDPRYEQYDVPREYGNGSGWVFEHANGKRYIITNNHVVETADEVVVTFFDKSTAKATILGTDPQTDIAVLEIADPKLLHPSRLAGRPVAQGEIVFAFGSPFRFAFSMRQGIVSGDSRQLGILDRYDPSTGEAIQQGYENFIQTDAAINPGNSGGPLVNVQGEVVGMSTAIASNTGVFAGLGFAIPVDMVRDVAGALIEEGKVIRGYLGVWIRDLDPEMARTFGFEGQGVLIDSLTAEDSPAAKAGLQPDDIIVAVNNQKVDSASELRRQVARITPGQTVPIKVFREGREITVQVKVEVQPTDPRTLARQERTELRDESAAGNQIESLRLLGLERLVTLTRQGAERLGLNFTPGVLVQDVRPNSIAASKGFVRGMIITQVQGEDVTSLEELAEKLAEHDLTQGVRFRVVDLRGIGRSLVLTLPQ
jgi:serine protease Do